MTDKNLYLGRAEKYVSADTVRGIPSDTTEYSAQYLILAESQQNAGNKLQSYLKTTLPITGNNWKPLEMQELTAGKDLPLEKRIEILKEVLPVIP